MDTNKKPFGWFDKNERLNENRELTVGQSIIDPWGERSVIIHLDGTDDHGTYHHKSSLWKAKTIYAHKLETQLQGEVK